MKTSPKCHRKFSKICEFYDITLHFCCLSRLIFKLKIIYFKIITYNSPSNLDYYIRYFNFHFQNKTLLFSGKF